MGLQSSSALGGIIAQNFFQRLFLNSLHTYVKAQSQLRTREFVPGRFLTESALRTQINTLNAIANVDTQTKAEIDVASSVLQGVSSQLNELAQLATSAIGATAGERAQLHASAQTLLSSISGSLASAKKADPHLSFGVQVTSPVAIGTVNVTRSANDIAAAGLAFTVAFNANGAGSQARKNTNELVIAGGTLASDLQFTLAGPDGSVDFSFTAGTSSTTITNTINDNTASTGIEAVLNGTEIELNTVKFGTSQFISITEISDAGGALNAGATVNGTNANGTITVNGVSSTFVGDGRTITFDAGGVSGTIELQTNTTILANAATPANEVFTVRQGGKALVGQNGELLARIGLPAFDFGSLGRAKGGLGLIDLVNDPGGALAIIQEAQADIAKSQVVADFASNAFLGPRITANADLIGSNNDALDNMTSLLDALSLFERVRAESKVSSSLAIISQLSGLFPASSLGLL